MPSDLLAQETSLSFAEHWFTERGWAPFDFQREVWAAMAAGDSGLLHATTGAHRYPHIGTRSCLLPAA